MELIESHREAADFLRSRGFAVGVEVGGDPLDFIRFMAELERQNRRRPGRSFSVSLLVTCSCPVANPSPCSATSSDDWLNCRSGELRRCMPRTGAHFGRRATIHAIPSSSPSASTSSDPKTSTSSPGRARNGPALAPTSLNTAMARVPLRASRSIIA